MSPDTLNFHEFSTLAKWFGCSTADMQKMVAKNDWCMWRQVEEKVMDNPELWQAFLQELLGDGDRGWYPSALLPTRAKALYIAYHSLQ